MLVCCNIIFYIQNLQKQVYNKGVKPKIYTFDDKVWMNSKYIKIKQSEANSQVFWTVLILTFYKKASL